jgi:hypothetical protein
LRTPPPIIAWHRLPPQEQRNSAERLKEWIESAKHILIEIQLRDNLKKTVVVRDYDGNERRILMKPKSSIVIEERNFV